MRADWSAFNAIGFSHSTALRCSSAASVISMCVAGGVTILTRSTSLRWTSSCQSSATCSMPNSFATASARSRRPLAMATIFAPMQSRKPGICVVRANPVPTIPIPTGAFFMAPTLQNSGVQKKHGERGFFGSCDSAIATGEFRDHRNELAGADWFCNVHLITGCQCLVTIFITRVSSQGGGRCLATFLSRQRSYLTDEAVAVFFRHCDVAQNHVRPPFSELAQRVTGGDTSFYFRAGAADYRTDNLARFRFVVHQQHSQAVERSRLRGVKFHALRHGCGALR